MLLSVHKKSSRLAVLGELGRFPVLLPAIKLCLKYQYSQGLCGQTLPLYKAVNEMKNKPQMDSWYSRVEKIKSYFHIKHLHGKPTKVGNLIEQKVISKFDRYSRSHSRSSKNQTQIRQEYERK